MPPSIHSPADPARPCSASHLLATHAHHTGNGCRLGLLRMIQNKDHTANTIRWYYCTHLTTTTAGITITTAHPSRRISIHPHKFSWWKDAGTIRAELYGPTGRRILYIFSWGKP